MSASSAAVRPALQVRQRPSHHWVSWALFGFDIAALEAAFLLGLGVRLLAAPWMFYSIGVAQYFGIAVAILLLPVVNYQVGLYPGFLLGPVERLRRRTLAALAVFGGLVAWDNIVERGVLSRGVMLATFLFALVLPPIVDSLARLWLVRRKRWGMPVVVLGAGETGRAVARTLRNEPLLGLVPVAFLDNSPDSWNNEVEGIPIAGPLALVSNFEDRAEAVIVVLKDVVQEDLSALLHDLNFPRVIVIPDLAGLASLWVTARDLGGCLGLEIKKNLLIAPNTALKRFLDQALALPLFLLSLPVIAVAAAWIRLSSRGPAFYRQVREGFCGRRIAVWKLRTMYLDGDRILEQWFESHPDDADHWHRHFKLRKDPRVLPGIGRLLRRTSLDELPQLWSVLRGQMSLVGPRPLPDYHIQNFSPEFRSLRTRVLPGLSGLWQVSARSDGDLKVQQALDTYYIQNWSPWLDVYILARTVVAVLMARGAY